MISVYQGEIYDVILDLRENSITYNSHLAIKINAHKSAIFLPPGIAHGFISKKDNTIVVYNQSTTYSRRMQRTLSTYSTTLKSTQSCRSSQVTSDRKMR